MSKKEYTLVKHSIAGNLIRQRSSRKDGGKAVFLDPGDVLSSLEDTFSLQIADPEAGKHGLRRPQWGGVHALLAHWSTGTREPATVVMPTGTGKTETMLAVTAATRPRLVLVLVPSKALRKQIAEKFETWGVLREIGVLSRKAEHLSVGRVKHKFATKDEAILFSEKCNVIVATPSALNASSDEVRAALLERCSHLFIDEAHHVSARTWQMVRDQFDGKPVAQFTATPYREDKRSLGGKLIYNFPLREAQEDGYFATINYRSVIDFVDQDRAIAVAAVQQLASDVDAGRDHLLMARANKISRVRDLLELYEEVGPEFSPVVLHSSLSVRGRRAALEAIESRSSRIILCVDMLGEGFDLPALKVAAIHDPHKSLGITLQFIGRFARPLAEPNVEASVVIGRPAGSYDTRLRDLYAEDADWNLLVRDLSASAVEEQEQLSDFETNFQVRSDAVSIRSLLPKMSAVAFRTQINEWNPQGALEIYPPEDLLTEGVSVNQSEHVAWFVTQNQTPVRWGNLQTVHETTYDLYVLFWDRQEQLLYINSSNNDSVHEDLAKEVCGEATRRIKDAPVYRVFGGLKRLIPTNLGVLDIRNRDRRFSMHVGADVTEGFPTAEAQTKAKTNIFATGYDGGVKVSYGASLKGRVWSHRAASNLKEWVEWCKVIGRKLTDTSTELREIMGSFILPETVTSRPSLIPLGIEWPWEILARTSEGLELSYQGRRWPLIDTDIEITSFSRTGPIEFELITPNWQAPYELHFQNDSIHYSPVRMEITVESVNRTEPLSTFLQKNGLTVLFEDETVVDSDGYLYRPNRDLSPYNVDDLNVIDWREVDIRRESQGVDRDQRTVQARMIRLVQDIADWDIVIDDDGTGEIADVVAMRRNDRELEVLLVHCKYSSQDSPGARVADLYEVCGQAQKSVRWRRSIRSLMDNLIRRESQRVSRVGRSGFEVGEARDLYRLQEEAPMLRPNFTIAIAQPGLSKSRASDQQLQLLASTEVYVFETTAGTFNVYCSE